MNQIEQKARAKDFVDRWRGRGDEKQDAQSFWRDLLVNVLGSPSATLANFVSFERKVPGGYIDVFIEDTGVLIEQKSIGIDLDKPQQQSDGEWLTPYEQGARYASRLPFSIRPRWIITCNFEAIKIYDQEKDPTGKQPQEILLENIPDELYRLSFITDKSNSRIEAEKDLSVKAGVIVAKLYNLFAKQYQNIETDEHEQRSLNILIVRLVFLLYAEDAEVFDKHGMLYDYLKPFPPEQMRQAVIELFKVLNTPDEKRDPYIREDLAKFPYINGGLFEEEDIIIPQFTDQIKLDLLVEASSQFNWAEISPTIFGAVFESTLNPETRRSGGIHYTSIENIHKVIDPLFLNDLKAELEHIEGLKSERDRKIRLKGFQKKLSEIKILDPACGSGNFLTESYLSLRKLENRVIENLQGGQKTFDVGGTSGIIQVNISQFFGIEINDFAVSVAKTAMWIAESQMIAATEEIVVQLIEFLPLKSNANIHEDNALRVDWKDILPPKECSYIIGNPPFIGSKVQTKEQKEDMAIHFGKVKALDYVCSWYKVAVDMMRKNNGIKTCFVSTNSICQGEQPRYLWKPLFDEGISIDYAYHTFIWDNEAVDKAHVHCVIIGFSFGDKKTRFLYDAEGNIEQVNNINGYLLDAPNMFVSAKTKSLNPGASKMIVGSQPTDGGFLIMSPDEKEAFIRQYPELEDLIHPYLGAREFLNAKTRYVLWLKNVDPARYKDNPVIQARLQGVKESRLKSPTPSFQEAAKTPWLFSRDNQPDTDYLVVPRTTSGRRRYIPIGFNNREIIASDKLIIVPNATLYELGLLLSIHHNAWMRVIAGYLKSDYEYAAGVYNSFIFPKSTSEQRATIEQCAQNILDIRNKYPDNSLADLYDPDNMPSDLRQAHDDLDYAVEKAYGVDFGDDEDKIVAHLFKLYAEATKK